MTVNANDSGPAGVMAEFMLPKQHAMNANQVRTAIDKLGQNDPFHQKLFEKLIYDIRQKTQEIK